MTEYSNKHLTEVVCQFSFNQKDNWDVGFFGQYFEKISPLGFKHRQDRKGFQIKLTGNLQEMLKPINPVFQETETQMLYKNEDESNAIILGNKTLSFHTMKNYLGWDNFKKTVITPCFDAYKGLGLSESVETCQYTYLNQFTFDETENLSDFFTLISTSFNSLGNEKVTTIDTKFQTANNIIVVVRLFANPIINGKRVVNLECGAHGLIENILNRKDYLQIAEEMHAPIRDFFEKIITPALKERL